MSNDTLGGIIAMVVFLLVVAIVSPILNGWVWWAGFAMLGWGLFVVLVAGLILLGCTYIVQLFRKEPK